MQVRFFQVQDVPRPQWDAFGYGGDGRLIALASASPHVAKAVPADPPFLAKQFGDALDLIRRGQVRVKLEVLVWGK